MESLSPEAVRKMSLDEMVSLADTIRQFLIDTVSRTGGHIGANLGVIELTLALHHVFESPKDRLVFDTGHQGYTHKIVTGRSKLFSTLNQWKGMNRFLARNESSHDIIDATHAGTSVAVASGIAKGLAARGATNHVVAIIGDGALVEGMAFEALNYVCGCDLRLVIVLNDNGMAIAPNVGGIRNLTTGPNWRVTSEQFFRGLGLDYLAVPDGHDMKTLVEALQQAKQRKSRPVLVHVKTEKGRGLPYAKHHPYKMHFSMPFDSTSGEGASPTVAGKTYAVKAAEQLRQVLESDRDVFVITPGTPYASSLDELIKDYPDRVFDVGMAEQHAVGMACGLSLQGRKPVVCFQTTFMQRAFDQLFHDASYMDLNVTFLGVRSGFAGLDGPTHHGLYDIPYLRSLPNMQLVYPVDSTNLCDQIRKRFQDAVGPMTILYPYDVVPNPEPDTGVLEPCGVSLVGLGRDGLILTLGNRLWTAHTLRSVLSKNYGADFGLACVQVLKPFPGIRVGELCESVSRVITLEEGSLPGGFGSLVGETLLDAGIRVSVLRTGVNDRFVPAGDNVSCSRECGMEPDQLLSQVLGRWPELGATKEDAHAD